MVRVWRIVLLSVTGFSVPVVIALGLAPLVFSKNAPHDDYIRQRMSMRPSAEIVAIEPPDELAPGTFREIAASKNVDPSNQSIFLVSSRVRFSKLPEIGSRERLFYKYSIAKSPYSGWAMALHRWPGSTRPEVYWRDAKGKGGWFAFGDVQIKEGVWYTFTFVVEQGEALSMYVGSDDSTDAQARFVGGFSVSSVATPQSADSLFLAPFAAGVTEGQHPVEVGEFFVAEFDKGKLAELKSSALHSSASIRALLESSEIKLEVIPTPKSV